MRDHTERSAEFLRDTVRIKVGGEELEYHGHPAMSTPIYVSSASTHIPMDTENGVMPSPNPSPRTTRSPSRTESIGSISLGCPTPTEPSISLHTERFSRYYHQSRVSKQYELPKRCLSFEAHSSTPPFLSNFPIQESNDYDDERLSKHEKRRRNHLNSEKKRRESIKGGMDALFEIVPDCRDIHMSKASILKKTKKHILDMHIALQEAQAELKRASHELEDLRRLNYPHSGLGFVCRL